MILIPMLGVVVERKGMGCGSGRFGGLEYHVFMFSITHTGAVLVWGITNKFRVKDHPIEI